MDPKVVKALEAKSDNLMLELIEAIGVIAATAVGQATAGGTGVTAGQSSQTTQTGSAHKNDVSVPELLEVSIGSMAQDLAHLSKVNARTFDLASLAGNLAGFTAGNNASAMMGNVTTQQNEEYSDRKKTGVLGYVVVGDAAEESADDSDRK